MNLKFHSPARRNQSGVSMLVVLVVMMLSMLMVLGTSKLSMLNEQMSGNNSDYQRAYEAAESVLRDAAIDIACFNADPPCVNRAAPVVEFTCDTPGFLDLMTTLAGNDPPCANGLCADLGPLTNGNPATSFWGPTVNRLGDFTANGVAARYGQFTNAVPAPGAVVNPLLTNNAWYWVEILPWTDGLAGEQTYVGPNVLKPDEQCEFAFRVTAIARGQKTGTASVLQALFLMRGASSTD